METKQIIRKLFDFSGLIYFIQRLFRYSDKLFINGDDDELKDLIKTDEDRATFHNTISELQRGDSKSKEVSLGGRKVTISL